VHPETRGNPMSMLRWTSKSTDELVRQGYRASAHLVRRLLHQMGYSLQAPAKVKEGAQHRDRDAQFRYLNDTAARFAAEGQPVISVDTKKKELVGEYANGGKKWQPEGQPVEVKSHAQGLSSAHRRTTSCAPSPPASATLSGSRHASSSQTSRKSSIP
jgi:hypothetical protein